MDPTNLTPVGDQYSLGCVLYFCLTGRYPFPEGTAVEKMMSHQHKQPPPIKQFTPEVPDELVAVVERLMQKVPANRYGSTSEVVEALRPLATPASGGRATRALPRPTPAREPRPERPPAAAVREPVARPPAAPASRPAPNGASLPTRQSLNPAAAAAPAPRPVPVAAPEPATKSGRSWDDRMGPFGVAACAVLACVLVWLVTRWLNLF
jgi:serine/threonine-protein kinase